MTARIINELYRDYVTSGVPSSGAHDPFKEDIRDTFNALLGSASTAAGGVRAHLSVPTFVASVTALKALDTTKDTFAILTASGRAGLFIWHAGDYSAEITADTQNGIYIKADAIASTEGAWIRDNVAGEIAPEWFGAVGDGMYLRDASMTASDATLNSASAAFTASDVGKPILVSGVGTSGNVLITTIASVTDANNAELTLAASTTASGQAAVYGTDNATAIAAAVRWWTTWNQFDPAGITLRFGRGKFVTTSTVDLSSPSLTHGLSIRGDSFFSTELIGLLNGSVIEVTGTQSEPINKFSVFDITIRSSGKDNTSAFGLKVTWSNTVRVENVMFFSCYFACFFTHNWQTSLVNVRGHGLGYDQNSIGIYAAETSLTQIDNALKCFNVHFQDNADIGLRGINLQGTALIACEFSGGNYGIRLGAPTTGTVLSQWIMMDTVLCDSVAVDGLLIEKGSATEISQIQLSNCWSGNANRHNLNIQGGKNIIIDNQQCIAADLCNFLLEDCEKVTITGSQGLDSNRDNGLGFPLLLQDSNNCVINGNRFGERSAGSQVSIAEGGTADNNLIVNNHVDNSMQILGSNSVVKGNKGFVTRNSGSADVLSTGSSVVVNHGLGRTPTVGDIHVTPGHNLQNEGVTNWWISSITSTQFTINTDASPTNNVAFGWFADVSGG